MSMWLKSDNAAGVDEAILDAMSRCNGGAADSYGDDPLSRRLDHEFGALFEHEVSVFPVASGTAANSLALASIAGPLDFIACHQDAHAFNNESGATTLMSGGAQFLPVAGHLGLMQPHALEERLDALPSSEHGAMAARAITVTQLTEQGAAYSTNDLGLLGRIAQMRGLRMHLDGARFANALAFNKQSPADMSWRSGVDVMSFGATKNGTMYADAVIFFDAGLATNFRQRLKRAGHSLSKTRFMAAQLLAYIDNGRWLRNANFANAMASRVAAAVAQVEGAAIHGRVEGNLIFTSLPTACVDHLATIGFRMRQKPSAQVGCTTFRIVTSFATTDDEVGRFEEALRDWRRLRH